MLFVLLRRKIHSDKLNMMTQRSLHSLYYKYILGNNIFQANLNFASRYQTNNDRQTEAQIYKQTSGHSSHIH